METRLSEFRDWEGWRRMRAVKLKGEGWSRPKGAEALGASDPAVSPWRGGAGRDGAEALRPRPAAGRAPRRTAQRKRLIPELLWHGPGAYGGRGPVWAGARIALVIDEQFGARYHTDHVGRSLKELGGTPQIPIRRAIRREDTAIRRGRAAVRPDLRTRARRERRALVFEGESGFYRLPGSVKTYAPGGWAPIIREKPTRDHPSVKGGVTPGGKVYTPARRASLNGPHRIEFLIHVPRVAGGRLLVIWDGSPIHRRVEVKDFGSGPRGAVWLGALPGYAPDLNPWDEGGRNHLKQVQLRKVVSRDIEELHEQFHLAVIAFGIGPMWFNPSSVRQAWRSPES